MATDTATIPHPLATAYWRRNHTVAPGSDPRREAREMGYVARGRDDDAPEEGSE